MRFGRFATGLVPAFFALVSSCASPLTVIDGDSARAELPGAGELADSGFTAAVLRERDTRRPVLVVLNPRGGPAEWKVREKGIRRRALAHSWNMILLDRPGGDEGEKITEEMAGEIVRARLTPALIRGPEGELRAVVYRAGGVRPRPALRPDGSLLIEFGRRTIERSEMKYSFEMFEKR